MVEKSSKQPTAGGRSSHTVEQASVNIAPALSFVSPLAPSSWASSDSRSNTPSSPSSKITRDDRFPPFPASTPSTSIYSAPASPKPHSIRLANSSQTSQTTRPGYFGRQVREHDFSTDPSIRPDRLTLESLYLSAGGTTSSGTGTPSVASSSEGLDLLGPLPHSKASTVSKADRPTFIRGQSLPASLPTRLPLASPIAGLSELFAGHSSGEEGYFSRQNGTGDIQRSGSSTKRVPPYSPFISNYAPLQHVRRTGSYTGAAQKRLEQDDSSPHGFSGQPPASLQGAQSYGSPQIRNSDGILAPHGTFTSSRKTVTSLETRRPRIKASSDSRLIGSNRRSYALPPSEPEALAALEKAAKGGDQLASYRLGLIPDQTHGERYSWGSNEDVWGMSSPTLTTTRRSSASSRKSSASAPLSSRTPPTNSTPNSQSNQSDLFSDAVHLTLQSNAARNASQRSLE